MLVKIMNDNFCKITNLPNGGQCWNYGNGTNIYYVIKHPDEGNDTNIFHREDGPAIILGDRCQWWLNDINYSEEEHAIMVALKAFW